MHAVFGGGPYGEDVGRCVGSCPDPDDPVALYDDTGPVPPPPLREQEKAWLDRPAAPGP